jgi:hypothetical protein
MNARRPTLHRKPMTAVRHHDTGNGARKAREFDDPARSTDMKPNMGNRLVAVTAAVLLGGSLTVFANEPRAAPRDRVEPSPIAAGAAGPARSPRTDDVQAIRERFEIVAGNLCRDDAPGWYPASLRTYEICVRDTLHDAIATISRPK